LRRRTVAALGKSSPGRCPCAAPSQGRPPRRRRPQARRRAARSPQVRKLHCADELAAAGKKGEEIASRAGGVGGDAVQLAPQLRRDGHRRRQGAHGAARAERSAQAVAGRGRAGSHVFDRPFQPQSLGHRTLKQADSFTGNRRMRAHCPDSAGLQSRKNRGRPTATTHPLTAKSHLPIKIEAPFRWAAPVGAVRVAAVVGNV
jgi:hypothetical protein